MLPKSLLAKLQGKKLLDFGMSVQASNFRYGDSSCVLPSTLVLGYVLAIAASGHASRILMAAFDGYGADDPRNLDVESLLACYQQLTGVPPLLAITPSRYRIPVTSVYSMI
jgi:4-hydroxy 2-oxovalerate aldolase